MRKEKGRKRTNKSKREDEIMKEEKEEHKQKKRGGRRRTTNQNKKHLKKGVLGEKGNLSCLLLKTKPKETTPPPKIKINNEN